MYKLNWQHLSQHTTTKNSSSQCKYYCKYTCSLLLQPQSHDSPMILIWWESGYIVYLPHSLTSTSTACPSPPTSQVYRPFIPKTEKLRVKYWTWVAVDDSDITQIVVTMAMLSASRYQDWAKESCMYLCGAWCVYVGGENQTTGGYPELPFYP